MGAACSGIFEICDGRVQASDFIIGKPQHQIATHTQQATHSPRAMVVVDLEFSEPLWRRWSSAANRTDIALRSTTATQVFAIVELVATRSIALNALADPSAVSC